MKRIIGLMTMVSMLAVSPVGSASADQVGIYVAPKFIYGYTQMNNGNNRYDESHKVGGGVTNQRIGDKTDNVFGGSIAIGYDFDKKFNVPIRTELEYAIFSKAKARKQFAYGEFIDDEDLHRGHNIRTQTLFLNAYWDINTGTKFTPYIGGGLGIGFIKFEFYNKSAGPGGDGFEGIYSPLNKTNTNFIWNLGAGLGYDINDNWTIDLGYRFVGLGEVKSKKLYDDDGSTGIQKLDLNQHQFALGVRFTF
jgi:opacity protein-like surface antigen